MNNKTKILLVQIRTDKMKEHEQECVQRLLPDTHVDAHDVFDTLLHPDHLDGYDGMIVGGSGEFCVSERTIREKDESIMNTMREARKYTLPMLSICYGHHLMGEAFGGLVEHDVSRQETGTYTVSMNDAASKDPLFSRLPQNFRVQQAHKDHVTNVPDGAVLLGSTDVSPNQVITFPGEPIYSLQFHPELSNDDLMFRLHFYKQLYIKGLIGPDDLENNSKIAALDALSDRTEPTPMAEKVLPLFVEEIVERKRVYPEIE